MKSPSTLLSVAIIGLSLVGVGCASEDNTQAVSASCPRDAPIDNFDITISISPPHAHVNEVIAFTFNVSRECEDVLGLTPSGTIILADGTSSKLPLTAAGEGVYTGSRALYTSGDYEVGFSFHDIVANAHIRRCFPARIEPN